MSITNIGEPESLDPIVEDVRPVGSEVVAGIITRGSEQGPSEEVVSESEEI